MKNTISNVINAIIKKEKLIAVIVLIVMAAAGLAVTDGYGVHLDEAIELSILNSNIKEYSCYIPGKLGDKIANAARGVERISESDEKDHGIAAYYGYVFVRKLAQREPYQTLAFHMYTFCIFMLGVLALYGIVKLLTNSVWQSLFASLMLYLSPRMFGEGHYNNKDIVVMAFVLITIYFGLKMALERRYRYAILFAMAAAVATNTKIAGAWFYGIIGIGYLITLIRKKELTKRNVSIGLVAIVVYVIFYVLVTPAMWRDTFGFIMYLVKYANDFDRWDNNLLFEGVLYRYSVNPPPAYYLPKMILITTPLYILVLIIYGVVMTAANALKECRSDGVQNHKMTRNTILSAVNILLWMFPLVFAVVCRTRVYNGWRHFYFIYGPMVITAAYGCNCLCKNTAPQLKKLLVVTGCAITLISQAGILINNPYQYAYFNVLAGKDAQNRYEMDYWMVSTKQALLDLYRLHGNDGSDAGKIKLASRGRMSANAVNKAMRVLPEDVAGRFEICGQAEADYLFVNSYGFVLEPDERFDGSGYVKEVELKSYGHEVCCIYRLN